MNAFGVSWILYPESCLFAAQLFTPSPHGPIYAHGAIENINRLYFEWGSAE